MARVRLLAVFFLLAASLPGALPLHGAVEVPCDYAGGLVWLKVKFSGHDRQFNFVLDSGAGETVIDLATAQRLGMPLGRSVPVQGVLGPGAAYRVENVAGMVAGAPVPKDVLAMDLRPVSEGCGRRIDGLLGLDFLRRHIVQIDYGRRTVRILQRGESEAAPGEKLALAPRNDALCVKVSVNGEDEWMRVDTGCDSPLQWVISGSRAKRLGVPSIGVSSRTDRSTHTEVWIGSARFSDVLTGIHDRRFFAGEGGLLGNGLLSKFTVTIDAAGRTIHLARR
jgi:predicted aspartyl protease